MNTLIGLTLIIDTLGHWHMPIVSYATLALTLVGTGVVINKGLTLGPITVWGPLLLLVATMLASRGEVIASAFAIGMLYTYLLARNFPGSYKVLILIVILGTTSLVCLHNRSGGVFFNYNIAAGALILCALTCQWYQWAMITAALVGLFFTGTTEAIIGLIGPGLVNVLKRDWGPKMLIPSIIFLLTVVITPSSVTYQLWYRMETRVHTIVTAENLNDYNKAVTGRFDQYEEALRDIKLFGHGYRPFGILQTEIHNVPLRALYEVGPIGAIAWLYLLVYGLVRTRLKYLFAAIASLSLLDHFMWTSLAPFFFVALGAGTVRIDNDNIFKEE